MSSTKTELQEGKNDLIHVASRVRLVVRGLATGLALAFGWLQLKGISIVPFATDDHAQIVVRVSLVLYYLSWVAGNSWDISDTVTAVAVPPRKRDMPWETIVFGVSLCLVFAALCWSSSASRLSMSLVTFWILDFGLWLYYTKRILLPMVRQSEGIYAGSPRLQTARLREFKKYASGDWQWKRWIVGALILVALTSMTHTSLGGVVAGLLRLPSTGFVLASVTFLFVLVVEIWIWSWRIRTRTAFDLLRTLETELVPTGSRGSKYSPKDRRKKRRR